MTPSTTLRVVLAGFSHGHAASLIEAVHEDARTDLVLVHGEDAERMAAVCDPLGVPDTLRSTDPAAVEAARPDLIVVCDETARHAHWVSVGARLGAHVLLEKPFAVTAADAREMVGAAGAAGILLGVNWPLAYYPTHRTAHRLLGEGAIGAVHELQYYDGNRGAHSWIARPPGPSDEWWLDPARGGGSLHDYLGYGTTLATWLLGGGLPESVIALQHRPAGLEVDTHSVVVARYEWGLATFQTRWGTLTNPWEQVSAPRTGFVIAGDSGVLVSDDYSDAVVLHTVEEPVGRRIPVDPIAPDRRNGLAEVIAALEAGTPLEGPVSAETSLAGQLIVEAALESIRTGGEAAL